MCLPQPAGGRRQCLTHQGVSLPALELAHWPTIAHPALPDDGLSIDWLYVNQPRDAGFVESEFKAIGGSLPKGVLRITTLGRDYVRSRRQAEPSSGPTGPRTFIVHGRDNETKLQVKNFLHDRLRLPEPIILHEQPNRGLTIIEKFEEAAEKADAAIVLLTPDDDYGRDGSNEELLRARQNVILELGYFLALFGRRSGKVLLLYKGPIELPTDLSGVVYIDISDGVEAAGEEIRREPGLS